MIPNLFIRHIEYIDQTDATVGKSTKQKVKDFCFATQICEMSVVERHRLTNNNNLSENYCLISKKSWKAL